MIILRAIVWFFTLLSPLLQRLGICATSGFIAGAFSGFILWLHAAFSGPPASLSAAEIIQLTLILTITAWLVLIFILVPLARISFISVWYSSMFNAFLTCLVTVVLVYKLNLWTIAYLVGMIVGIWIGLLLCFINNRLKRS